ncbi:MAG: hypothetical protein RJQ07_02660 [Pseudomonadales bacterium]
MDVTISIEGSQTDIFDRNDTLHVNNNSLTHTSAKNGSVIVSASDIEVHEAFGLFTARIEFDGHMHTLFIHVYDVVNGRCRVVGNVSGGVIRSHNGIFHGEG